MADIIKIAQTGAKAAEKVAEEVLEHSPAAQKLAAKLLEDTGFIGNAIKLVTKEFEHLAGAIETKGIHPNLTHTFQNEIRWQSFYVQGSDAKTLSLCKQGFQTIENPTGITYIKNLLCKNGGRGEKVLEKQAAPQFLFDQGYGVTAAKGVPNWLHGSDDWLFYQANKELPTKVVLDDVGRLHAIEYLDDVKALAGPFKGLSGKRFEINYAADGLKTAKMRSLSGRTEGYYDHYEYEFGTPHLKCSNWDGSVRSFVVKRKDLIPEDIKGNAHRVYRSITSNFSRPSY